jgi:hypothetical protein
MKGAAWCFGIVARKSMRLFKNKLVPVLPGLLVLVVILPLIALLVFTWQKDHPGASTPGPVITSLPRGVTSWPVISRDVPAFASSGYTAASDANDASYDTSWRSQGTPAWLAYDLSEVPASHRDRVLVVWYNISYNYNHTIIGYYSYNMPQDYTIDVNPAPGRREPPASGWVTLVKVNGNHYHSRQHIIDMKGDNWLRIRVTAIDGAPENYDANINMDVYDASSAVDDDWIFYGDSITAGSMGHTTVNGVPSFAQLINARVPDKFPVEEAGGTGFLTSADGAEYINVWLSIFPGKFVALSFGTNDANGCANPDKFYSNYLTMVQAVLNAGKTPVLPHIPWGRTTYIQQCGPSLNAEIDALYKAFPQIIKGPDLWAFFQSHQQLISNDNIHPTNAGDGAYRQQWANAMLAEVYTK